MYALVCVCESLHIRIVCYILNFLSVQYFDKNNKKFLLNSLFFNFHYVYIFFSLSLFQVYTNFCLSHVCLCNPHPSAVIKFLLFSMSYSLIVGCKYRFSKTLPGLHDFAHIISHRRFPIFYVPCFIYYSCVVLTVV